MPGEGPHPFCAVVDFGVVEDDGRLVPRVIELQAFPSLYGFQLELGDNDADQSAEEIVRAFASTSSLPVTYCNEPQQNIALVRNNARLGAALAVAYQRLP